MFRRSHDSAPKDNRSSDIVTPTEGREITVLPNNVNGPEQRSRVLSHYVTHPETNGTPEICTELTIGRTVCVRPEAVRIRGINERLELINAAIEKIVLNPGRKVGYYVIEDPRNRVEDPIRGRVIVKRETMKEYEFIEDGEEVAVTGSRQIESSSEKIRLPVGTRITASVRAIEAQSEPSDADTIEGVDLNYVADAEKPTPEAIFMGRLRDAIDEFERTNEQE